MGRAVIDAAEAAGVDVVGVVSLTRPDGALAARWLPGLDGLAEPPGLVVDFSLPEGTREAASWCRAHRVALLSGVTGLSEAEHAALRKAAERVPVLWSPNLSLGVNLLASLTAAAASVLGHDTPVEIDDRHHRWKKDSPSGTALMLGAEVAAQRDGDDSGIAYSSRREGEVIGEHTVRFRLDGEIIELAHRAQDRGIFARGALAAGLWLRTRGPGLYTARDWLSGR